MVLVSMKLTLETPTPQYALRTLITWSFLVVFNLLYVFFSGVRPPMIILLSYLLSLLFVALATSMQIPEGTEEKPTTQVVTYSLALGLLVYGSVNLILYSVFGKWPVLFLTAFGGASVMLSALFGYLCAESAKLYPPSQ